jgi:hypothetical protein
MDWRLMAAVGGAGGSFCLVAAGAYFAMTAGPASPRKLVAAPPLFAEARSSSLADAPAFSVSSEGKANSIKTSLSKLEITPGSNQVEPSPFAAEVPLTSGLSVNAPAVDSAGAHEGQPKAAHPREQQHEPQAADHKDASLSQRDEPHRELRPAGSAGHKFAALTPAEAAMAPSSALPAIRKPSAADFNPAPASPSVSTPLPAQPQISIQEWKAVATAQANYFNLGGHLDQSGIVDSLASSHLRDAFKKVKTYNKLPPDAKAWIEAANINLSKLAPYRALLGIDDRKIELEQAVKFVRVASTRGIDVAADVVVLPTSDLLVLPPFP